MARTAEEIALVERGAASDRSASRDEQIRDALLDAAIASILERGYYRASSNEIARRADVTPEMVDKFLTGMYRSSPDFVFTVTRDFVRDCQTPVLILPDDIPAHPYAVAMEAAMLAPKAEVSMFPWQEPKERIPLAIRQIRSFLRAHLPA